MDRPWGFAEALASSKKPYLVMPMCPGLIRRRRRCSLRTNYRFGVSAVLIVIVRRRWIGCRTPSLTPDSFLSVVCLINYIEPRVSRHEHSHLVEEGRKQSRFHNRPNSHSVGRIKPPSSDILLAQSLWLSNNVLAKRFPMEIRHP